MPFDYVYGFGRTPAIEKIEKNIFTNDIKKRVNFDKL